LRGAVCADGEDVVGRHGGADRVLLSPWSREIEHLGSSHSGAEVELLKAAARQRLAAGQGELDLGLAVGAPGGPLPITASRMAHLWDALMHGYRVLGFERAAGGDEVFAHLVLARIIEPTSKLDSARVLEEAGVEAFSYRTVKRRLPVTPSRCGGSGCRRRELGMRASARPAWCFTTCPRCISRLMRVMDSGSRGSPRSGVAVLWPLAASEPARPAGVTLCA
jgi:hypothetical protein